MTGAARIRGRAAQLDEAILSAAGLLAHSRSAVLAGLGTDMAGGTAVMRLAKRIGGVVDHMHADALLRDLGVMQQAGWIVTTPLQVRARADMAVLVGGDVHAAPLGLDTPPTLRPDSRRCVVRLGTGPHAPSPTADASAVQTIAADPPQLPMLLGVLRAVVAGRPVRADAPCLDALRDCAKRLKAAAFAVVVWSAGSLDALAIEMLCGLIDDLNATTRCAGLPLPAPDNAIGIAQVAASISGFPPRVGFGRGRAEHDPWRFDAARMADSGEADLAVWISALTATPPPWAQNLPLIALVAPGTAFASPPEVEIIVGCPGTDHPGVMFDPTAGALVCRSADPAATRRPSVAEVVQRIDVAVQKVAAAC
ncbi:MAG TPA: hypothetical protein VFW75_01125 [Acetobacteraceae bacterium]|nr:hypothetical protein [Acetobacteraceae bacterium]